MVNGVRMKVDFKKDLMKPPWASSGLTIKTGFNNKNTLCC
jgi:hypothetical protein